jgi:hypothetical protein
MLTYPIHFDPQNLNLEPRDPSHIPSPFTHNTTACPIPPQSIWSMSRPKSQSFECAAFQVIYLPGHCRHTGPINGSTRGRAMMSSPLRCSAARLWNDQLGSPIPVGLSTTSHTMVRLARLMNNRLAARSSRSRQGMELVKNLMAALPCLYQSSV